VRIVTDDAIVVENLEKKYPPALSGWRALLHPFTRLSFPALAGVSFRVRRGEVLAVIGPNGAGKSTLLRILSTLLIPTAGRALIGGFDVERDPSLVRRLIGMQAGESGFYARLTPRENLLFFAALQNLDSTNARQRIEEVAQLIGLAEALDRPVRMLSTGQVNRLGLARAMLHGPAVLLLDEPTRSLDPIAAAEFRRFLKSELVGRRGTTLLFASHSLAEVEELADRIVLLASGRIAAIGSPAEVRKKAGAESLEQALEALVGRAGESDS